MRLLRIPYPILMVIGGLVLGFVPGVPSVALHPQVVLVLFLPPLLYIGAFFTSLRDVRRDARSEITLSSSPSAGHSWISATGARSPTT